MTSAGSVAPLLQGFFTDRLVRQRQASAHTIAAYRDTFRLLLQYTQRELHKTPTALAVDDLDAPLLAAFLTHLERDRGNTARTRNARLAALHSFFRYVALAEPAASAVCQRVLALPSKRYDRALIDFLTHPEIEALLAAPDRSTWTGRRDHALLLLAIQTGLRVAELTGLHGQDVVLDTGAHIRCRGKGRKERATPLAPQVRAVLRHWIAERQPGSADPLFCTAHGRPLSRDAVAYLLTKYVAIARRTCPSLVRKRVSPHVLRHTTAMQLLLSGTHPSVIALWLGHESVETTQMYIDANLALKEAILAKTAPLPTTVKAGRFQPGDRLLAFLNDL